MRFSEIKEARYISNEKFEIVYNNTVMETASDLEEAKREARLGFNYIFLGDPSFHGVEANFEVRGNSLFLVRIDTDGPEDSIEIRKAEAQ